MTRTGTTALLCGAILVPLPACQESEPVEEAGASYTRPAYARPSVGADPFPFRFTEATAAAGIDFEHVTGAFDEKWMPETMGSGGGFLDYDGDGLPDLFFVNSAEWPGHRTRAEPAHSALYRNRGDGTFEDASEESGIARLTAGLYGMGATFGDYDGDGDLDIYLTAVGDNLLLRNDGGRFMDVTADAGVSGNAPAPAPPAWSTAAAWLDADRDGRLDLFVCNYVRWTPETDLFTTLDGVNKSYATPQQYPGESCRLYRNRNGRRFDDVTRAARVWNEEGKALGVVVVDFDRDGWPDVVVANDTQPNFLYRNDGDGTFTEVGLQAGIAFDEFGRARAGMGVDAADVTGQGRLSIAIGNFSQEALALYTEVGEGVFQDLAGSARLTRPTLLPLTFGVAFVDLDLDGFQDLITANGHIEPEINAIHEQSHFEQRPQLFHNTGRGTFIEVGEAAGRAFRRPAVGRGVAIADYDRDGDPDVLITVNGGRPRLLRNDTPPEALGRWLRLRLEGRPPNTHAVGATVTVFADDRMLRRRVRTGSSYLSQSETNPLLFGLGSRLEADSVRVEWPTGARSSTVAGRLRTGRIHTIREGG